MRMKMSFKSQYIMSLFDQVSKDIVAAMKAKDKVRLEALRNIKKFFIEAKTLREPTTRSMMLSPSKSSPSSLSRAATRPLSITSKTAPTSLRKRRHRPR